jgi:hypothetical protein
MSETVHAMGWPPGVPFPDAIELYSADGRTARLVDDGRPSRVMAVLREYGTRVAHELDADPDKAVDEATVAEFAEKTRRAVRDEMGA